MTPPNHPDHDHARWLDDGGAPGCDCGECETSRAGHCRKGADPAADEAARQVAQRLTTGLDPEPTLPSVMGGGHVAELPEGGEYRRKISGG
ncbi:MAG: hypothetical protein P4L84_11050 [Isosphaeraceae bacterium]|nr:hypothetical protein [Isosphaeraceae bacterium]